MQVAHIRPPHTTVITSPHQHRPTDTEGPASLPEHSEDFSVAATTATGGDSEEVSVRAEVAALAQVMADTGGETMKIAVATNA